MTQIISAVGPGLVLQASDRLVSQIPSLRPYDSNANKSLILGTVDGVAVIGYTGLAYIDGRPTDLWMAEILTGWDLSAPTVAIDGWHAFQSEPLHSMITRLGNALKEALRPYPQLTHQVLVAGWTYKPTGSRPTSYLRRLDWLNGTWAARSVGTRMKGHSQQFWVTAVPRLPAAQLSPVVTAIECWTQDRDVQGLEDTLAAVIRGVDRPGVGPDCLTTVVDFSQFPPLARVRFMPAGPIREAFTPWTITPAGILPPSREIGGGSTARFGRLDVQVVGAPPEPGSDLVLSWSPMPRVPPP